MQDFFLIFMNLHLEEQALVLFNLKKQVDK